MIKKILRYLGTCLIQCTEPRSFPNLLGDRDIEWSFIAAHIPDGPGQALDFGTGGSTLALIAARKKFQVISVDLARISWQYDHPNLEFIQGDLLEMSFPEHRFDVLINCSTIEHVGLAGRYAVSSNKPDGDIEAMGRLRGMMKPEGRMLVTLPVGKDAVFLPLHRVYGFERLPLLFKGYTIEHEEYWVKNDKNVWIMSGKTEALTRQPQKDLYGIGCFILRNA